MKGGFRERKETSVIDRTADNRRFKFGLGVNMLPER